MTLPAITTEEQLDSVLAAPSPADIASLGRLQGDILILGAGGKMGPTLALLAKRASDAAAAPRKIIGAARFSAPSVRRKLASWGIETIRADLLDRQAVNALPTVPNVIFMAGQKFGTVGNQALTWAVNTHAPAIVAEKFRASRIVVFSTGNVYPLTAVEDGGPDEESPLGPVGEYAQSALGRERTFEYFSRRNRAPVAVVRLQLRRRVALRRAARYRRQSVSRPAGRPGDGLRQRDLATGRELGRLAPARILRIAALRAERHRHGNACRPQHCAALRRALRAAAQFTGTESRTALLSNAAKYAAILGPPETAIDETIDRVADWIRRGGATLGKPTHFEERGGNF